MSMKINIIAAIGKNNEIGLNNQLLWRSKSELEHFKKLTLGKPIIMGRKTFESLPGILPGRLHIVISSNFKELTKAAISTPNLLYACDLDTTLTCLSVFGHEEVFVIGGASIFEQAMPLADELHISHMDWSGEADTFFPTIGPEWIPTYTKNTENNNGAEPDWQYCKYTKTKEIT